MQLHIGREGLIGEYHDEIEERVAQFLADRNLAKDACLGARTQGTVWILTGQLVSQRIAVRFHQRQPAYQGERDAYRRLRDLGIQEVGSHMVPQLIEADDHLLDLAMTIVSPSFFLDLEEPTSMARPTTHPESGRLALQTQEESGDHWPTVEQILADFEGFGIYIADVNPGNIRFR